MQPKKSLGQNFLRDPGVLNQIVDAICPHPGEMIVEVGPGEGVLTGRLLKAGAKVFAVELDDRLINPLRSAFSSDQFHVCHGNIMRVYLEKELAVVGWGGLPFRAVGNLPYYVASGIIRLFLEGRIHPTEMFFMLQKEVAERLSAPAGEMSLLSVCTQYYARADVLFAVPAAAFTPIPKVESAFVRIVPKEKLPLPDHDTKVFFRIVKSGFSARRKTLANNLANSLHLDKTDVFSALSTADLLATARPQELSVEQWTTLFHCLHGFLPRTEK